MKDYQFKYGELDLVIIYEDHIKTPNRLAASIMIKYKDLYIQAFPNSEKDISIVHLTAPSTEALLKSLIK